SHYMAELVLDSKAGRASVFFWNPHDEQKHRLDKVEDWKLLTVEAKPLTLTWEAQPGGLLLKPHAGAFQASDDRLKTGDKPPDGEQALRDNNLNSSGGYGEHYFEEMPLRFQGRLGPQPEKVVADLKRVPLKKTGERTVVLENVADVTLGPAVKRGDSSVNGSP